MSVSTKRVLHELVMSGSDLSNGNSRESNILKWNMIDKPDQPLAKSITSFNNSYLSFNKIFSIHLGFFRNFIRKYDFIQLSYMNKDTLPLQM